MLSSLSAWGRGTVLWQFEVSPSSYQSLSECQLRCIACSHLVFSSRLTSVFAVNLQLQSLPPVEQRILQQRFGLDGRGERSLKEVGSELKLSAEMVRKYEARAVMKLQAESRNTALAQALQSAV